ncbi:Uncharacterized protein HZ326_14048 [Fusarium oxysporum f. sp. albedinis]|nr:Uncharacterized protein HZ326_14048 [Fusarium oxysporum f. sp. albedinis]
MGSYVDEDWTEESQEEYRRDVKQLQDLFYLDTCEDPSFDRLSVHQIRQVCVNNPPGNKKTMASYHFRYVLLANKAVVIWLKGLKEDLKEHIWPGGFNLHDTGDCSGVRRKNHYDS